MRERLWAPAICGWVRPYVHAALPPGPMPRVHRRGIGAVRLQALEDRYSMQPTNGLETDMLCSMQAIAPVQETHLVCYQMFAFAQA